MARRFTGCRKLETLAIPSDTGVLTSCSMFLKRSRGFGEQTWQTHPCRTKTKIATFRSRKRFSWRLFPNGQMAPKDYVGHSIEFLDVLLSSAIVGAGSTSSLSTVLPALKETALGPEERST